MTNITDLLQSMRNGSCATVPAPTGNDATVCTNPTSSTIIDANAINASACEDISFTVQNADEEALWLIWGTRGRAGVDPLFPLDPFVGASFADSPLFLVNTAPNGAPFQGFNYRCANTGYILQSITVRQIPVASGMQNASLKTVSYGCDPDNLAVVKKIAPVCSPCSNNNDVFTEIIYNLGARPIDDLHAIGLLVSPGVTVVVNCKIVAMATAKNYVACGSSVPGQ